MYTIRPALEEWNKITIFTIASEKYKNLYFLLEFEHDKLNTG
jgi:hypothetical protein